jgi:hypothetical protein
MTTSAYARQMPRVLRQPRPGGVLPQDLSSVRAATAHGITQKEFRARHCRDPQEKRDPAGGARGGVCLCGLRPGRRNDRYGCESERRRNRRLIDLSRMISVSSREVFSPQPGLTGVRRGGGSALRPPSISARVRHRGRRAGRPGHRRVVTPSPGAAVWVSPRRAPEKVAVMAGPA